MKSGLALLVVGLSASMALADNARPRGGGSGGGGSESTGARHHGGGSSASSGSRDSGRTESARPSSSSISDAEARRPRPGTGTGHRRGYYGGYRGGYYGGYYGGYTGYPYYYGYRYPRSYVYFGYSPFWFDDYYWGYGPSYAYYNGYWGPGYRRAYYDDDRAALRIQVHPDKAKVYVDGYYAGVVDDFNGLFQRLHVSPGRHEITVKMDGYRTHTWKLYAPAGDTVKLQHDLVAGTGQDPVDEIAGSPVAYNDRRLRERDREPRDERGAPADVDRPRGESATGEKGRVNLSFLPDDATVYIDGEFRGTARQVQTVELSPGPHRIEVVRPGYVTYEREIEVRSGDTSNLRVELEPR